MRSLSRYRLAWHGRLAGRIEQLLKPDRDFSKTVLLVVARAQDHMAGAEAIETSRVVMRRIESLSGRRESVPSIRECDARTGGWLHCFRCARRFDRRTDATHAARDMLTLVAAPPSAVGPSEYVAQRDERVARIHQFLLTGWNYRRAEPRGHAATRCPARAKPPSAHHLKLYRRLCDPLAVRPIRQSENTRRMILLVRRSCTQRRSTLSHNKKISYHYLNLSQLCVRMRDMSTAPLFTPFPFAVSRWRTVSSCRQ